MAKEKLQTGKTPHDLEGKIVVLDTPAKWIYIGMLASINEAEIILKDVDAFDVSETTLTKQEYLAKVVQDGLAPNRKLVRIAKDRVLGITLLADVLR